MYTNQLVHETSPYLLQHSHQKVNWYPWGEAAFEKAKEEDRPVFLSIGYSTCHWCHVMSKESFDDAEIAELLNENFISIKVDREERPDVDSVYMSVCQLMTGGGGWPMSIFLTPEKKPFYAGTYFPKDSFSGMLGFRSLLEVIAKSWRNDRNTLLKHTENIIEKLSETQEGKGRIQNELLSIAVEQFRNCFDSKYGGFGDAPKFPTPHNLMFLLQYWRKTGDGEALGMAELTLKKMHSGGLFDHIGFGFSRYSTDRKFKIPHFEKMLYDNALLIMAYADAYDATEDTFYLDIAKQTADYILREMVSTEGGFYSAQDADSEGVEGRYYAFKPSEVCQVLGKQRGEAFNRCYGITEQGNFHGLSIPQLEGSFCGAKSFFDCFDALREYRKKRYSLHLDDKVLAAWNGLMIAAFAKLSRVTEEEKYLQAAIKGMEFIEKHLEVGGRLYVSYRNGRHGSLGFLDDYACVIFALLNLHQATQESGYLEHAIRLCERTLHDFKDDEKGGFYQSGRENEILILRPKESYDGAIPSGNSIMAYNLVMLSQITEDARWDGIIREQLEYLSKCAEAYPMSHAFFLLALSNYITPPSHVTIVPDGETGVSEILRKLPMHSIITVKEASDPNYPLLNGKTTYYVCTSKNCLPPSNDPKLLKRR